MIFKVPSKLTTLWFYESTASVLWRYIRMYLQEDTCQKQQRIKETKLLFDFFLAWLEIKELRQHMICVDVQIDLEDEIWNFCLCLRLAPWRDKTHEGWCCNNALSLRAGIPLWHLSCLHRAEQDKCIQRTCCWESWYLKRSSEDTGDTRASKITHFSAYILYGWIQLSCNCWLFAMNSCVFQSSPGMTTDKTRQ